jgi:WD40 repeat protein
MSGADGDTGGVAGLLAPVVARARERAPRPLRIACGLGGGGEPLVRALQSAAGGDGEGEIVDFASTAGVGPASSVSVGEEGEGWRIVLTRDASCGARRLSSIAGPELEEQLFCELLSEACAVPHQLGAELVERLGCPTALIDDLAAEGVDWTETEAGDLLEACWQLGSMAGMREAMGERGGHALFDLGRTLCLMDPVEMELSDEWALLAGALSGRTYSIADISLVLGAFPGLFEVVRRRHSLVRPSSRLARELLLGGVAPSQSEHLAIYRALRDRSVAALEHADDSDRFIARQLPRQATAAAAIPALAADPLGILSSDSLALLSELESEPAELRKPAAKMIALCAHRLLDGPDRASHLELSARRIGLDGFADALTAELPVRRWRPLWAQAELAHTHRVALDHSSPLLGVAAVAHPGGLAFAGSADGAVWRISPYEEARRLEGADALGGEIRALAARSIDGRPLVAIGTSAHAVGVLDGDEGSVVWLDADTHRDPLSVSFIHAGDGGVLLTAGVGGTIYRHPLHDGAGKGEVVYRHGSEIRDVQVVEVDGSELIVFCAVNGIVGILLYEDGSPIARWHIAEDVLNSVAAAVDGDTLLLVVGTSQGSIRQLRIPTRSLRDDSLRGDEWGELTKHPRAINCVRVFPGGDDTVVLSGSSDGSWQWNDRNGTRQRALGHVGPVWSIDLMEAATRRYVITAGGEGACRLWLTDAVLDERIANSQPLAHRGPVSAIELVFDPAEEILVITGGADGDVRAAAPSLPEGGELLTRHDSEISALLSVPVDKARSHIASGSVDGTLRLTSVGAGRRRESVVLGIAHEGVTSLSRGRLGEVSDLVSGGMDGTITAWDLDTRAPSRTVQGCPYGSVQALCHLEGHGEGLLVAGGQDGTLNLFRGESLEPSGDPRPLEASVLCLSPLPGSGTGLLAGLMDGRVAVVEEVGLYEPSIRYIKASDNEIRGLGTLILGGRLFLACAGLDRHLRLLDVESGKKTIDIDLDGYALTLKALGASVGLGTSAGACVIAYPMDMIALSQ